MLFFDLYGLSSGFYRNLIGSSAKSVQLSFTNKFCDNFVTKEFKIVTPEGKETTGVYVVCTRKESSSTDIILFSGQSNVQATFFIESRYFTIPPSADSSNSYPAVRWHLTYNNSTEILFNQAINGKKVEDHKRAIASFESFNVSLYHPLGTEANAIKIIVATIIPLYVLNNQ